MQVVALLFHRLHLLGGDALCIGVGVVADAPLLAELKHVPKPGPLGTTRTLAEAEQEHILEVPERQSGLLEVVEVLLPSSAGRGLHWYIACLSLGFGATLAPEALTVVIANRPTLVF